MQIERMFRIVHILMGRPAVTAREFAEKLEVSTRTIYRDVELLSRSGIPVYASKGKNGGISLMEGYVLNSAILSEQDQNDVLSALRAIHAVEPGGTRALSKLSELFRRDAADWIGADFSDWGNAQGETFETLKHAILNRHVVTFSYFSSAGVSTNRRAQPFQLWFKHRSWYLKAYCLDRLENRLFRVSRMRGVADTGAAFTGVYGESETIPRRPPDISFTDLILRVRSSQAHRVLDEFGENSYTTDDNGDFIVYASYPEDEWVYGFLLSFGPGLTVISPERVKDIIARRLGEALENYR